jgi:hypothetical protein
VKHYLTASEDCLSDDYTYSLTEKGHATMFNIIPEVGRAEVTYIQSVGNLYNCPNSFVHAMMYTSGNIFRLEGEKYKDGNSELGQQSAFTMIRDSKGLITF